MTAARCGPCETIKWHLSFETPGRVHLSIKFYYDLGCISSCLNNLYLYDLQYESRKSYIIITKKSLNVLFVSKAFTELNAVAYRTVIHILEAVTDSIPYSRFSPFSRYECTCETKRSGFISILLLKRLIWGHSFTYKTIKTRSRRAARIGNLFEIDMGRARSATSPTLPRKRYLSGCNTAKRSITKTKSYTLTRCYKAQIRRTVRCVR